MQLQNTSTNLDLNHRRNSNMNYIDADKMIAEIERQQRRLMVLSNTEKVNIGRDCAIQNGVYNSILVLINSLQQEQLNVNLEKEIDDFMAKEWDGIEEDKDFYDMIKNDLSDIAKHFFVLGLKAQKGEKV